MVKRKQKGFTLIELMMVVIIIGVITALAIPRYLNASASARKKEALRILKQILELEHAYYLDEGVYQLSTGPNEIPHINFMEPSMKRRYDYTVEMGKTGDLATSLWIVATEIDDADLDGVFHERILMDELGHFYGDWEN